jgi:hypothetical protein
MEKVFIPSNDDALWEVLYARKCSTCGDIITSR